MSYPEYDGKTTTALRRAVKAKPCRGHSKAREHLIRILEGLDPCLPPIQRRERKRAEAKRTGPTRKELLEEVAKLGCIGRHGMSKAKLQAVLDGKEPCRTEAKRREAKRKQPEAKRREAKRKQPEAKRREAKRKLTRTTFQYYSKSIDKYPGTGSGEYLVPSNKPLYVFLDAIPDWRKRLSNLDDRGFTLDGKKWATVEHYYQAAKYRHTHPELYDRLSVGGRKDPVLERKLQNAGFDPSKLDLKRLSTDGLMSLKLCGRGGSKKLEKQGIHIDPDFFGPGGRRSQSMINALFAKFTQHDDLKRILLLTGDADLVHFKRGNPFNFDGKCLVVVRQMIRDKQEAAEEEDRKRYRKRPEVKRRDTKQEAFERVLMQAAAKRREAARNPPDTKRMSLDELQKFVRDIYHCSKTNKMERDTLEQIIAKKEECEDKARSSDAWIFKHDCSNQIELENITRKAPAVSQAKGNRGRVFVASMMRGVKWPRFSDIDVTRVNVTSGASRYKILFSPMTAFTAREKKELKNIDKVMAEYHCFENYWQGGKRYPNLDDQKKIEWWKSQKKHHRSYPRSKRAHKYDVPYDSRYPPGKGTVMGYVESRKKVYVSKYYKMIKNREEFLDLVRRVNNGENVIVYDFDGPRRPDGCPDIQEVSVELLRKKINYTRDPFGHGYVVAAALAGIPHEKYTK